MKFERRNAGAGSSCQAVFGVLEVAFVIGAWLIAPYSDHMSMAGLKQHFELDCIFCFANLCVST